MKANNCKTVVQKMNNQLLESFLTTLGLTKEGSQIFSFLIQKGPATILNLSRLTNINRTKIYRLVEGLEKMGMIQEIVEENKTLLKAVDLHQLELLVQREEEKTQYLRKVFPEISALIPASTSLSQPSTKVIFYRGVEGIRQMVWNTLRTKGELVGYTYRYLDEIVGEKFGRDWHEEWVVRKLKMRDIYSDIYIESKKKKHIHSFPSNFFESKYISNKILNVNHQIDIYNDIVGIYNWHESEVFGVEIYNEKVASLQRQLFEIVWKVAQRSSKK